MRPGRVAAPRVTPNGEWAAEDVSAAFLFQAVRVTSL
jgi:hypothetical protein